MDKIPFTKAWWNNDKPAMGRDYLIIIAGLLAICVIAGCITLALLGCCG